MSNKYNLSNGLKIEKSAIDRKIRQAKEAKLNEHFDQYGYYFCTTCKQNDDVPIDVAHIISVDACQKSGRSELSWDLNNLVVEGRKCHRKRDKTY
jgi:hypothetical protein